MKCPLCAAGRIRLLDRHVELSERGERDLGPCESPDEVLKPPEFPFKERLAAWRERMNRDCHKSIPMPVSDETPPPARHETEKERET